MKTAFLGFMLAAVITVLALDQRILVVDLNGGGDFTEIFKRTVQQIMKWVVVILAICVGVAIVLSGFFQGTCPQCDRNRALKWTGGKKKPKSWLSKAEVEWRCKYCGYTEWREERSSG